MGDLAGIGVVDVGAGAILALVVLLVLTGRLVPRATLLDMRQERDTWRSAHTVSEEARREAQRQAGELLELSRTAGHVLASLPTPEGVDDAVQDRAVAPPS